MEPVAPKDTFEEGFIPEAEKDVLPDVVSGNSANAVIMPSRLSTTLAAAPDGAQFPIVLSKKSVGNNNNLNKEQRISIAARQAIGNKQAQRSPKASVPSLLPWSFDMATTTVPRLELNLSQSFTAESSTRTLFFGSADTLLPTIQDSTSFVQGPPEQQEAKPFRFLDLPPELRNAIYEKVMEDEPAVLRRSTTYSSDRTGRSPGRSARIKRINPDHQNGDCRLFSRTALCRTNRQIRLEYLSLSAAASPEVRIEVLNFDFARATTWINSLSELELSEFHAKNGMDAKRQIIIDLVSSNAIKGVSRSWMFFVKETERWVRRISDANRKESKIRFEYSCNFEGRWVPFYRALDGIIRVLRLKGDKSAIKEWQKIKKAWKKDAGFEW